MGEYADETWYLETKAKLVERYGEIPPPWIYMPGGHPYSIRWRQGSGETFIMVFFEWFNSTFATEEERVQYFLQNPPPPRWLSWLVDVLWDGETMMDPDYDYTSEFKRLEALGFNNTADYLSDIDDEKWLQYEPRSN